MTDPNIKTVQVTGSNAVPEMGSGPDQEGGGTRKRQRKAKAASKTFKVGSITKEGGGATSPGTIVQMSASQTPAVPGAPAPVGAASALTEQLAPTECLKGGAKAAPTTKAAAPAPTPVKVVLAAPKKKKGKVVLAAAKAPGAAAASSTTHPSKPTTQTRKAARKVRVSMKSLSKKIHKARTIRKEATDTTIEHVKKALQKAGLIKADSKAPDTILRQMYADYLTLKSRAL